jgi:hypothetical protein
MLVSLCWQRANPYDPHGATTMSTTTNLLLSSVWFALSALTPWALLPAAACLACAALTAAYRLDDDE